MQIKFINNKKPFLIRFFEKSLSQFIQLFIQILLSRLLYPSDFGIVAILLAIINILQVIIQFGLTVAIVQTNPISNITISTAFWFSTVLSILFFSLILFFSPIISSSIGMPNIVLPLRLLSFSLLFIPFQTISHAIIMKKLLFSYSFIASLISNLLYGLITLILASAGFNYHSIVIGHIISQFIFTTIQIYFIKWIPTFGFSFKNLSLILRKSINLFISSFLFIISDSIFSIFIGYRFKERTLGLYNRGIKIPLTLYSTLDSSISPVALPLFVLYEKDNLKFTNYYLSLNSKFQFLIQPLFGLLYVISSPLIIFLLSDRWIEAIEFMKLLTIDFLFSIMLSITLQAFVAKQRNSFLLFFHLIKAVILIASVFLYTDLIFIIYLKIFTSLIILQIYIFLTKFILITNIFELFKSFYLSSIPTLISICSIFLFNFNSNSLFIELFVKTIVFLLIYFILSYFINKDIFIFYINELKNLLKIK